MIRKNRRAQGGFTLIEAILSIAILIVLMAVSVTGAILYRSYLKITELDNAAREIYLAAQNRAVLLSNRSALRPLLVRADNQLPPETANEPAYYYISDEDARLSQLLPSGTVDPALLDGSFYIVYEPESGSVTDVFFQQGAEFTLPNGSNFNTYYSGRSYREKNARRQAEPMTGWYSGDPGEDGDAVTLQPPDIIIYNEDTLRAEIRWWVPRVLSDRENDITLKVSVTYGEEGSETTVTLGEARRVSQDKRIDGTSVTHTDVYLLDSLFEHYQFKDLFTSPGEELGGPFTLTAEVSYTGSEDLQINPGRDSETDNSLFAKDSTDTTANIAYMRHLQNLHRDFSGVSSTITYAVQTRAIENPSLPESYDGTGVTAPYHFIPIRNDHLTAYDGDRWEIRRLLIKTEGNAGLFDNCVNTLTDVRLMNPTVQGEGCVGTLCARAKTGTVITGCQSYWMVDDASQMDLRYLLGTAEKNTYDLDDHAVEGKIAGGIVGAGEDLTIISSSASATVSGTTAAGGLVGQAGSLTLRNSYADCYLTGGSGAGLVGELSGGDNTFTNVYAVGFISNKGSAAGLYLGQGTAEVHNSYAAMGYNDRGQEDNRSILPLASGGSFDVDDHVYYLKLNFMSDSNAGGTGLDSAGLTKLIDEGAIPDFVKKGASSNRAYNLRAEMALTSYPYPGLEGMTHYGDWPDILQINSLVYWENYEKNGDYTGIYGGNANLLRDDLGVVIDDGYAVVLDQARVEALDGAVTVVYEPDSAPKSEVKYSADGSNGAEKLVLIHASIGGVDGSYYLAKLPTALVNTDTGVPGFYQKIVITPTPGGDSSGTQSVSDTYYYCPHFANTALAAEADRAPDPPASVAVRSARHLYHLSHLGVYSNNTAANCSYTFVQQMDIDYSKYEGSFDAAGTRYDGLHQRPIGDSEKDYVFSEVYDGGGHTVSNVPLEPGTGAYTGLFGSNSGSILNTVFLGSGEDNPPLELTVSASSISETKYVGSLAGRNSGVIRNCAAAYVKLTLNAYGYSTIVAGGLVGVNSGQISRCSAATDGITLKSTNSNGYVGGFTGQNASGGSIDRCYALAAIAADGGTGIGTTDRVKVVAAGFAAENRGNLSDSYAAADLSVSRGAVSHAFCPGLSVNCCYLNSGNFVYVDNKLFSIQNDPAQDIATALVWDKLKTPGGPENPLQGFTAGSGGASESGHVLPCIVTDSSGRPRHYGNTITALKLGAVGMYYWEHEDGGNGGYHFSVVTINTVTRTVSEYSTLCTNHADGGVIDEYGYGYFWAGEENLTFTNHSIVLPGAQNAEAASALRKLMNNDRYHFAAYTTVKAPYDKSTPSTYINGTDVSGTWSFAVGGNTFTFTVNPFFADAFALMSGVSGYENELKTHIEMPGTENHPFGVRAVAQLQLINWNDTTKNCSTAFYAATQGSNDAFPYLQKKGSSSASFVWKQSHDLDGRGVTFQPIAAFIDNCKGQNDVAPLSGWFGGTYNGSDYTIKNLQIVCSAQQENTVGLFGVTLDAQLEHIVLFSDRGNSVVLENSKRLNEDNSIAPKKSSWYAVGSIVGLAIQSGNGRTISNCSAAGYTVDVQARYIGYGGGGVGGLVGICNMQLSHCTAYTTVKITNPGENTFKGTRTVRVGGLAGTARYANSIQYCYAGGTIDLGSRDLGSRDDIRISAGGLFGGVFVKNISWDDDSESDIPPEANSVTVSNSYSYVDLPAKDKAWKIYGLGGPADLDNNTANTAQVFFNNCYYLKDLAPEKPEDDPDGVTGLQFSEMDVSDPERQSFLTKLNSGGAGFGAVTTTADGQNIDGKYSYSTAPELQGLNYPFPTILSMNDGGRTVNVHYGDWPLGGIERADGSGPVRVDLFADYRPVRESGALPEEEYAAYQDVDLWLSELLTKAYPHGKLELAELDEESAKVCGAELLNPSADPSVQEPGEMILRITGLARGSAKVTVKYMDGDKELASIDIPVDVAAELQLAPRVLTSIEGADPPETKAVLASDEAVILMGAEYSMLDLYPFDVNGDPIAEKLMEKVTLTTGEDPFQFDKRYISSVTAAATHEGACLTAKLEGAAPTATPTTLTVDYTYAYQGQDYTGSNTIICQVRTLAAGGKPMLFFGTGEDYGEAKLYEAGMLIFETEKGPFEPENVTFTSAIGSAVNDSAVVRVEYSPSHKTVTVRPKGPGQEKMYIGVSFSYGLCRHKTTVYPIAVVYDTEQALRLQSDNIRGEELVIHTAPADSGASAASEGAPAAAAVVSIQEYMADGWTVQWKLDEALDPYLTVADPGARTAELTLSGGELSEEMTGVLTVTVTTDVPDAAGAPYVLEGNVSVRIIPGSPTGPTETPGEPSGEPTEPPGPGDAPVGPSETPRPQMLPRRRRSGTVEKKEPVWRAPQKN